MPFGSIVDFVPCCIAYATSLDIMPCYVNSMRELVTEILKVSAFIVLNMKHVTSPYKDLSGHIHIFLYIFMSPVKGLVMCCENVGRRKASRLMSRLYTHTHTHTHTH